MWSLGWRAAGQISGLLWHCPGERRDSGGAQRHPTEDSLGAPSGPVLTSIYLWMFCKDRLFKKDILPEWTWNPHCSILLSHFCPLERFIIKHPSVGETTSFHSLFGCFFPLLAFLIGMIFCSKDHTLNPPARLGYLGSLECYTPVKSDDETMPLLSDVPPAAAAAHWPVSRQVEDTASSHRKPKWPDFKISRHGNCNSEQ